MTHARLVKTRCLLVCVLAPHLVFAPCSFAHMVTGPLVRGPCSAPMLSEVQMHARVCLSGTFLTRRQPSRNNDTSYPATQMTDAGGQHFSKKKMRRLILWRPHAQRTRHTTHTPPGTMIAPMLKRKKEKDSFFERV